MLKIIIYMSVLTQKRVLLDVDIHPHLLTPVQIDTGIEIVIDIQKRVVVFIPLFRLRS